MKKLILLLTVWAVSFAGWAVPDTEPHDVTKQVTFQQIDRSSLPTGRYDIFYEDVSAANGENVGLYNASAYVCRSSSNSINGACVTQLMWGSGGGPNPTPIKLRFTEKRSHISLELTLQAQRQVVFPSDGCGKPPSPLNNAATVGCSYETSTVANSGSALNLWFDQEELKKLPVGGIWTATLILDFHFWNPDRLISTYTVNFLVDMTDKANIQVWLPEFGKGNPLVDLNLRPKISGGSLVNDSGYSGKNVIDMCLYDGYSTNSSTMQLQFSSAEGGSGTNNFILKDSASHELPYQVNFAFNGQDTGKSIINGEQWNITNASQLPINWNRILPVSLPDLSIPVLCWPAKMTLSADLPSSQSAGQYQGILKMVFTPSTTAI